MSYCSPHELRAELAKLVSAFAEDEGAIEAASFHQVVTAFAPFLRAVLSEQTPREARAFGQVVNRMVEAGGAQQNAIETCLLEHASQMGCTKLLKPHLNSAARKELR
jgi:hypothetical protein